jgi:hypothetical protein
VKNGELVSPSHTRGKVSWKAKNAPKQVCGWYLLITRTIPKNNPNFSGNIAPTTTNIGVNQQVNMDILGGTKCARVKVRMHIYDYDMI